MGYFTDRARQQGRDITTAKGTESGNYLGVGNFIAKIERCKMGQTRSLIDFFVAELRILKSSSDTFPPGSSACIFIQEKREYPGMAEGNWADFMRAGLAAYCTQYEIPPAECTYSLEIADAIVGVENILAGTIMDIEGFNKPTKSGSDFTRYRYTPMTKEQMREYL